MKSATLILLMLIVVGAQAQTICQKLRRWSSLAVGTEPTPSRTRCWNLEKISATEFVGLGVSLKRNGHNVRRKTKIIVKDNAIFMWPMFPKTKCCFLSVSAWTVRAWCLKIWNMISQKDYIQFDGSKLKATIGRYQNQSSGLNGNKKSHAFKRGFFDYGLRFMVLTMTHHLNKRRWSNMGNTRAIVK